MQRAQSHFTLGIYGSDDSYSMIKPNKPEERKWLSTVSPMRPDNRAQSEKPKRQKRKASKKKVKSIINRLTKLRVSESMNKSD